MVLLVRGFDCLRRVWDAGGGAMQRLVVRTFSFAEKTRDMLLVVVKVHIRIIFPKWICQGTAL